MYRGSDADKIAARRRSARLRAARTPAEHAAENAQTRQYQRAARRDPVKWSHWILYGLKRRAKRAGLAFNLTAKDVTLPHACPVFGVPFVLGVFNHPLSPTVDRIRPEVGYVAGNVRVISRRANAMKQDAVTTAELEAVLAYMRREGL